MTINSDSSIMPSFLSDHDQIELIAPARSVSKKDIDSAIKIIESNNFSVTYSKNLFDYKDIFSGTKNQRIDAFQKALDNPKTKAIFFVRGGYGAIQIIDDIDFSNFSKNQERNLLRPSIFSLLIRRKSILFIVLYDFFNASFILVADDTTDSTLPPLVYILLSFFVVPA